MSQKYTKEEHLKKESQIKYLFESGLWCNKYPLKVIYSSASDFSLTQHRVGVSVSKRNFKKAVDRNYIKRLLRECYRLNKPKLNEVFSAPQLVMIIYASSEIVPFQEIEKKYIQLLDKIKQSRIEKEEAN